MSDVPTEWREFVRPDQASKIGWSGSDVPGGALRKLWGMRVVVAKHSIVEMKALSDDPNLQKQVQAGHLVIC